MKRRDFLRNSFATAGALGLAATSLSPSQAADDLPKREFIELRTYTVKDAGKRELLVKILDAALIPALNAQGIKPIGVFVPLGNEAKYENNVFVVIPHKTMDSFLNLTAKLLADKTYMERAGAIFETDSKNAVYTACDSQLLQGFETCPVLEVPDFGPELGSDRVFEMRLYRSFNIERNAAKIHMFEHGGELALFRELGLNPIFFGEAIFGKKIPNLTYMVGSKNAEELAKSWKNFGPNPKWHVIRDNPAYKDTATEIDRVVLKPSPGSQI